MEKIIVNTNGTYTIKFSNWSVTGNSKELEAVFNTCFEESILKNLKQAQKEKYGRI